MVANDDPITRSDAMQPWRHLLHGRFDLNVFGFPLRTADDPRASSSPLHPIPSRPIPPHHSQQRAKHDASAHLSLRASGMATFRPSRPSKKLSRQLGSTIIHFVSSSSQALATTQPCGKCRLSANARPAAAPRTTYVSDPTKMPFSSFGIALTWRPVSTGLLLRQRL
jgi:hypothetical protein